MARKYGLQAELVQMQWNLLPLTIHPLSSYRAYLPRAVDDMKHRDPEDAHALALARSLDLPLWSNDRDFENISVERYTTAQLLRLLAAEARGYH